MNDYIYMVVCIAQPYILNLDNYMCRSTRCIFHFVLTIISSHYIIFTSVIFFSLLAFHLFLYMQINPKYPSIIFLLIYHALRRLCYICCYGLMVFNDLLITMILSYFSSLAKLQISLLQLLR